MRPACGKHLPCLLYTSRRDGLRLFKADVDDAPDHFELDDGDLIKARSDVGRCSIIILDLNRSTLVRLRGLRRRIAESMEEVAFGLRALRGIRIDQMAKEQRLRFSFHKHEVESESGRVDAALMKLCRSELLDSDDNLREHSEQRRAHLKEWRVQYPDPWWSERKRAK